MSDKKILSQLDEVEKNLNDAKKYLNQEGGQIGGILPFLVPILAGLTAIAKIAAPAAIAGASGVLAAKATEKLVGKGFAMQKCSECGNYMPNITINLTYMLKNTHVQKRGKE